MLPPNERMKLTHQTRIKFAYANLPPVWWVSLCVALGITMKKLSIAILLVLISRMSIAAEPLSCHVGPIHVDLGSAQWQVTSCSDGRSLVFATMKENPAMPFVFIVQRKGDKPQISGEGNGSKEYSSTAFEELKSMTESRFDELVQATKRASAEK